MRYDNTIPAHVRTTLDVYLDGARQAGVVAADTEGGWVDVTSEAALMWPTGEKPTRLRGRVEIVNRETGEVVR